MMDEDQPVDRMSDPSHPDVTRRRALMIGAIGASAVVSIRPALAQTAASISMCQIPVPDPGRSANYIAPDGSLVKPGTTGAFPGGMTFRGEDVRRAMNGGTLPGVDYDRSRAYMQYIGRLQQGTSGFTCYASLQMPRR